MNRENVQEGLPPGWALERLGAIGVIGSSRRVHERDWQKAGVPFYRAREIVKLSKHGFVDNDLFISEELFRSLAANGLVPETGDIMITGVGTVGVPYEVRDHDRFYFKDASVLIFKNLHDFPPGFLFFTFQSPDWKALVRRDSAGTTVNTLTIKQTADIQIPIPPLNEQKRIVAKIEALQARSDAAKEALDAIPPLLEKFRQSVLAAAFRGDLTKKWREAHPNTEPASKLLERIRAERRRRWEAANPKKKYVEPEPVDPSGLPALPDGWCWAELGLLGEDPLATVQTGPFGAQLHNTEFTESGVPVIAVGNLTGMGFTRDDLYFVSDEKADQLSRYDVQAGDVLFARSGATLGKVCVAPAFVKDWRMTGHILRARLNLGFVLPEIVVLALAGSPAVVGQVKAGVRGMTRPGYNTGLLEGIVLPIPPLAEQVTLLARVQNAFDQVGGAATATRAGVQGLTALNQSILAKAFRGELVPQDPSDEPASALLERIREAREESEATSPSKRRKGAGSR